jgi:hypothetical protein
MGRRIIGEQERRGAAMGLGGGAAVWLLLWISVGSPEHLLLRLHGRCDLPPFWLLWLILLGWYALAGMALGSALLGCPAGMAAEARRWQGSTFSLAAVTLFSVWYVLLVGKRMIWLSAGFLLLSAAACAAAVLCWRRWNRVSAALMTACAAIALLLFLLQLGLMVR